MDDSAKWIQKWDPERGWGWGTLLNSSQRNDWPENVLPTYWSLISEKLLATKPKFAAIMEEAHLFKEKQAGWRGECHIFQISISQFYALCSLWGEAAWPRLITIRYETGKALFPQQFTACIPLAHFLV